MPDLHGWITQQIADREQLAEMISPGGYAPDEWRIEPSRSGRWAQIVPYSRLNNEPPDEAVRDCDQPVALVQTGRNEHVLIAMHDPASVLRRCAADRKILAEHKPREGGWYDWYACEGCGYDGADYCTEPMVSHINDCPTLLALAEGYGLTEEQRAALGRPEKERPTPTGPTLISDAFAEAIYGPLLQAVLATDMRRLEPRLHVKVVGPGIPIPEWLREDLGLPAPTPEPTPAEKAIDILRPELENVPGYTPTRKEQP